MLRKAIKKMYTNSIMIFNIHTKTKKGRKIIENSSFTISILYQNELQFSAITCGQHQFAAFVSCDICPFKNCG